MPSSQRRICIVKIGSAIIAGDGEHIDDSILRDVCRQIAELKAQGHACIIVTSGATISGRTVLEKYSGRQGSRASANGSVVSPESSLDNGDEQLKNIKLSGAPLGNRVLAAIGQSQLISRYATFLYECHPPLIGAQILLTRQTLADRERYNIIKRILLEMLDQGIVPIINDNDPVKSETAKFADNDQIAAYVAGMLEAVHVVFISDAGGVYDKNPKVHSDAKRIPVLPPEFPQWPLIEIDDRFASFGGMAGKLEALRLLNILGIPSHVVSKLDTDSIVRTVDYENYLSGGGVGFGTRVCPARLRNLGSLKRWLSTGASTKGILIVSDKGAEVFSAKAASDKEPVSLLAVGVMGCHGTFEKGDIVTLRNNDYAVVGIGRTRFSSREIAMLCQITAPEYKLEKASADRKRSSPPGSGRSSIIVHNDHMIPSSRACFVNLNDQQLVSSVAVRMKISGYTVRSLGSRTVVGAAKGTNQQLPEIVFEGQGKQALWRDAIKAARHIGVVPEDWILFSCLTDEGLFDGRTLSEENLAARTEIPG